MATKISLVASLLAPLLIGKGVVAFRYGGAPLRGVCTAINGKGATIVDPESGEAIDFPLHRIACYASDSAADSMALAGKAFAAEQAEKAAAFAAQLATEADATDPDSYDA